MEFKFDIKDLAEGGIAKIDHTLTPLGCEEDEKYDLKSCILNNCYTTGNIIVLFLQLAKESCNDY